jgi:hypothetical protein
VKFLTKRAGGVILRTLIVIAESSSKPNIFLAVILGDLGPMVARQSAVLPEFEGLHRKEHLRIATGQAVLTWKGRIKSERMQKK